MRIIELSIAPGPLQSTARGPLLLSFASGKSFEAGGRQSLELPVRQVARAQWLNGNDLHIYYLWTKSSVLIMIPSLPNGYGVQA